MRKFGEVYKVQQTKVEALKEGKLLDEFKAVYGALLEKYNIKEFYDLNEEYQGAFINELGNFWNEKEGLTNKGEKFLHKTSDIITEGATTLQKKNYLKKRSNAVISESLRQGNVKWKLYSVIDEMYNELKAENVSEILSPDIITEIIQESFLSSLSEFLGEINWELNESSKDDRVYFIVKDSKSDKYVVKHAPKNVSKEKTGTHRFDNKKDAEAKAAEMNKKSK
ncbi:MAG: hypothetical protein ACOC1K_07590 [Nanoarchaeota archaeon]